MENYRETSQRHRGGRCSASVAPLAPTSTVTPTLRTHSTQLWPRGRATGQELGSDLRRPDHVKQPEGGHVFWWTSNSSCLDCNMTPPGYQQGMTFHSFLFNDFFLYRSDSLSGGSLFKRLASSFQPLTIGYPIIQPLGLPQKIGWMRRKKCTTTKKGNTSPATKHENSSKIQESGWKSN